MSSILGMGCIAYDMLSVVDKLPEWERLEYIQSYDAQQGGMAATAMVAASVLGGDAEFIGAIGDDEQADFHVKNFGKYGVKCDRMFVRAGGRSPFTFVLVEKGTGKRIFFHHKGVQAADVLCDEDVDFGGATHLLLDGFFFDTALRMARRAREQGLVTVTDTSMRNRNPKLMEYLDLIDYPVLSEVFAMDYSGIRDPLEAGKKLLQKGNKALLVTCSGDGLFIITREGSSHVEPFKIKPVDTTGAGDVFHGAFIFSLWKGFGLTEAATFSSAVSAIKCTKMGGQSGIPNYAATKKFILENRPECASWL